MARGDIFVVNLPQQAGREQAGKRPALCVQVDTPGAQRLGTIMVVPMTSNLKTSRFAHSVVVRPSPTNGLTVDSVLLVAQLRAYDRALLGNKLGTLEPAYQKQVDDEMRALLGL